MDSKTDEVRRDQEVYRRRRRRKKIRDNASNASPQSPGPSGGGALPTPAGEAPRNRGGGGGGGGGDAPSKPAAPLGDVPEVRPNSPVWSGVSPGRAGDFFTDPGMAATLWQSKNGYDPSRSSGAAAVFDDLAQYAPGLWELTQGATTNKTDMDFAQYLDFVDRYLSDYSTPFGEGGGLYDASSLMGNLFNGSLPQGSGLDAILNDPLMDVNQQRSALLGVIQAGLGTSLPGSIVNSIMHAIDQEAKIYGGEWKLDDPQQKSLLEYLKTRPVMQGMY